MAAVWVLLVVLLAGRAVAEPQDVLDETKWREDLAVLREQMPKNHGNLFHTMSRAQFEGALDALEAALRGLTSSQVKLRIMQLVAMVNDGHTRVRPESLGNHTLPVRLHFFADGLYVVSAASALCGHRRRQGEEDWPDAGGGGVPRRAPAGSGGRRQRGPSTAAGG